MGISVGIIGAGWVGSSVAISLLHAGVANEILLADLRLELAEGEAMDLTYGASFSPVTSIRVTPVEEMTRANAIVVAAGRAGRTNESRLDLLRENANAIRDLGNRLKDYAGIIVMVSNPVDVLTYILAKSSGIAVERVIGTGTMLDTARLRQAIGEELHLDSRSIHAQVVGEHGDSEVVLWSGARVGDTPLREWPEWRIEREPLIAGQVRTAAYEIIRRKGAINHAIGLATAALLRWMLRGERRVLTVSRIQTGMFGDSEVALSLPAVVGADGATRIVVPPMSAEEREALQESARTIHQAIQSIDKTEPAQCKA